MDKLIYNRVYYDTFCEAARHIAVFEVDTLEEVGDKWEFLWRMADLHSVTPESAHTPTGRWCYFEPTQIVYPHKGKFRVRIEQKGALDT